MKKTFIVTGELSGDRLGAWYVKRVRQNDSNRYFEATGGDFLKSEGVPLFENIDKLSIVGIVEIVRALPFVFKFLKKLSDYIIQNNFDEVVLIDYPGFNLMLAKRLKKIKPDLKITYFSPPQLWAWGAWRVKKIRKNCDKVIVLYPFEVEWFQKRGVKAEWLGYPFYEDFEKYFELSEQKKKQIAILPGSRKSETKSLFPIFVDVIKKIQKQRLNVEFILPLAESLSLDFIDKCFKDSGFDDWHKNIRVIYDEEEKWEEFAKSALAISKPGTSTLQLALLGTPTIILYKASWISYLLARPLIKIKYMGLPNLFLDEPVFPEFLQGDCTSEKISKRAALIYESFLNSGGVYQSIIFKLQMLRKKLIK